MHEVAAERRHLVVRATRETDEDLALVVVEVEDAGVGLREAEASQLFDPFYTTKPGGLGMGLSISRSIIEGHGGRLWATANPDHGATFHFALPGVA
jgi:signal transduction histidine kinase